jgi:hypothetical protein
MEKSWDDMTIEERFERLRQENQSTRQAIAGIAARLDEVGGVVIELEKQLKALQAGMARQGGQPRPVLKLDAAS